MASPPPDKVLSSNTVQDKLYNKLYDGYCQTKKNKVFNN